MIQQVGGRALALAHPMAQSGAASTRTGSALVLAILAMTLIGLVASLLGKSYLAPRGD